MSNINILLTKKSMNMVNCFNKIFKESFLVYPSQIINNWTSEYFFIQLKLIELDTTREKQTILERV